MIADAGFTVEGATSPTPAGAFAPAGPLAPSTPRPDPFHVRRRGPGTTVPANT